MPLKLRVLKDLAKFTGKTMFRSLLFKKAASFLKKRLQHTCFPVNYAKFFRQPNFVEHLWWVVSLKLGIENAETYLGPCQTSIIKLFCETLHRK